MKTYNCSGQTKTEGRHEKAPEYKSWKPKCKNAMHMNGQLILTIRSLQRIQLCPFTHEHKNFTTHEVRENQIPQKANKAQSTFPLHCLTNSSRSQIIHP